MDTHPHGAHDQSSSRERCTPSSRPTSSHTTHKMARSALKLALAAEQGKDPRQKKFKKQLKAKQEAKQAKKNVGIEHVDSEDDENDDAEAGGATLNQSGDDNSDEDMDGEDDLGHRHPDLEAIDDTDSDSESDIEMEEKIIRPKNDPPKQTPATKGKKSAATEGDDEDDEEEDEDEEDEDVPLSDLEDEEDREDVVPHTKLTINNKAALLASLERIRIETGSSVPFATHQSLSSSKPTADAIPDISDDLQRELALLSQSLEAARKGRALLIKEKVPFSRPSDYFAEMVKDDGQMEKVRSKLVEEATAKKAAAEARKLRDLKKFGKQVQIAKLQERQKAKRETLEKIKTLKKKNGTNDVGATEGDLFDVAVDEELKGYSAKGKGGSRSGPGRGGDGPNAKRQKKNEKYGFGGKKRHGKSGDAMSSGDVSGFNNRRGGGVASGRVGKPKAQRPGKNRRKSMASK
ncbi:eukaryotic rRNA processing protein EBP2-domain-containing protein [Plectosphaerella plurivora]|uniref:Eukaryotic rRNA processing protein EBP2-domain-containing protein n=1 Tax=Plectosphaerella plurivora TaxID=936078 RepID=A0A9P8VBB0_9PEZI|nr:eukaryotic rRNA processing protein EBP2-domain-containing protein [Plectosphaerella plurivora]